MTTVHNRIPSVKKKQKKMTFKSNIIPLLIGERDSLEPRPEGKEDFYQRTLYYVTECLFQIETTENY